MLDQLNAKNAVAKDHGGYRKNFVSLSANSYKPRMRGAAYTSKIMSKKSNSLA